MNTVSSGSTFAPTKNQQNSFDSTQYEHNLLIPPSLIKRIRNTLFSLFVYVYSDDPARFPMHNLISFIRFGQLFIVSLLIPFKSFWDMNTMSFKTLSLLSFCFHGMKYEDRADNGNIILIIYLAICVLFLALISISAYLYRKTGKLAKWNTSFISIMMSSVMFIIHPAAMEIAGETIKTSFENHNKTQQILIASSIICFVLYYLFYSVFSFSFEFRPVSLLTLSNRIQTLVFLCTNISTFVLAFASTLEKNYQLIFLGIGILPYFYTLYCVFAPLSFVSKKEKLVCFSISLSSLLNTIGGLVFLIRGTKASDTVFFVQIGLFIACFIFGNSYLTSNYVNQLLFMDQAFDEKTFLENYNNKNYLLKCCVSGFIYGHPMCTNWEIFKVISTKWPSDIDSWYVYGKFVSMFPEEYHLLAFICQSIKANQIGGLIAKRITEEIKLIQQRRESILTPILKQKINSVQRNVQNIRRKLRHMWDQIIQGNSSEMDHSAKMTYNSLSKVEVDFNHLLNEYPNNRFVVKSYIMFLQDILSDRKALQVWQERLRILQRGISVIEDRAHYNGIHYFPYISTSTKIQIQHDSSGKAEMIDLTDKESDFDQPIVSHEHDYLIQDRIQSLKYPSFRCAVILLVIIIIVLGVAPIIVSYVSFSYYQNLRFKPLELAYHVSYLRSIQFHISSFCGRLILEEYPNANPIFNKTDHRGKLPKSLGSTDDTREQIRFLMNLAVSNLQSLDEFRSLSRDDDNYKSVQQAFFSPSILYLHFTSIVSYTAKKLSLQSIILDYISQSTKLIQQTNLTIDLMNNSQTLNAGMNSASFSDAISAGLLSLINSMKLADIISKDTIFQIQVGISVTFCLLLLCVSYFSIKSIENDKKKVFLSLMSLPKSVVSTVVDNLKLFKNGETESEEGKSTDSELSKQEETILKIFFNAGDSSFKHLSYKNIIIMSSIIISISFIIVTAIICDQYRSINNQIIDNVPHVDSILGTSGYLIGNFIAMNCWVSVMNGIQCGPFPAIELSRRSIQRIGLSKSFYLFARYGGQESSQDPFPGFEEDITEFDKPYIDYKQYREYPTKMRDIYSSFSLSQQILLVESFVHHIFQSYLTGSITTFDSRDEMYTELWYMVCFSLYEDFFFPMFDRIIPNIIESLESSLSSSIFPVFFLLSVICIVLLIEVSVLFRERSILHFIVSQLLHCPTNVLLDSPKIMELLSGDFSTQKTESSQRNAQFFESIMNNLPDAIVVTDNAFIIQTINNATRSFFQIDNDEWFYGKNIKNVFYSESFVNGPPKDSLTPLTLPKVPFTISFKMSDNSVSHFQVFVDKIDSSIVFSIKNITQNVRFDSLIAEERQRCEKLLASILPLSLVKRVQAGETNISFSIQTASIIFIDIVEFTPWCAANTAATVMSTLNYIFREFDSMVNQYRLLSRIKCIGDCYMAAGGVFAESQHPAQHAKEAVQFGIDALNVITKFNEQFKQNICIRVGIHTGGPIIAGVLGIHKPSFELLGKDVSIAQDMEHTGIPMKVQVSRAVYELVYGTSFEITERGEIMTNHGKMITYLIK